MKRALFTAIILTLLLVMLVPAPALAASPKEFSASGGITEITPGEVYPAGNSGRWRVMEREFFGEFTDGDLSGEFVVTYHANIESLETQAGNFNGSLVVGDYTLKINGQSAPLTFAGWHEGGIPLLKLTISGKFSFQGMAGNGDFEGYVVFIPTPEGHVYSIEDSYFEMTGKWKP